VELEVQRALPLLDAQVDEVSEVEEWPHEVGPMGVSKVRMRICDLRVVDTRSVALGGGRGGKLISTLSGQRTRVAKSVKSGG
jgi:hypothetical protein